MNAQMIRVISSPSSSTIGLATLIFAIPGHRTIRSMATTERSARSATNDAVNQAPPLENYNLFEADRVLSEAVEREGAEWATEQARELGAICGRPDVIRLGVQAN